MRILFISNYYPPYFEGGYEISVKETADYLHSRGHEVYVLTGIKGVDKPPQKPLVLSPQTPCRILKYINYIHGSFMDKHHVERFNYFIVQTALKQLNPDLVYLGNMKAISIAPVIAVQHSHLPHIFDIGDIWLNTYFNDSLGNRINRLLKRIIPFTIGGKIDLSPAIVLSKWMKHEIVNRFHTRDVYIVPRGIELPDELDKLPAKPLRYVFLGRIEPAKGLDICIRAFAEIRKNQPDFDFSFDVIGSADESYLTLCKALIETNQLTGEIKFLGQTNEAFSALQNYDVMLMPTLAKEAFGRVIIEAMACKCIVVASAAYGPAEIITDGVDGFLFNPGSVPALVQIIHILSAMNTSELQQIALNARKTVSANYEISLVKSRIEDILVNIVNNMSK